MAMVQAWAASSLEDHIVVHTGLVQENTVVVVQHPAFAANGENKSGQERRWFVMGRSGSVFCAMFFNGKFLWDDFQFLWVS